MEDKKKFHIGTGVTSLIMIFVVLCLTTFAVLSFAQARSDYKLTRESADNISSYYQARNKVVRNISDINEKIMEIKKSSNKSSYLGNVKKALADMGYELSSDNSIVCQYEMSDKQSFVYELSIKPFEEYNGITVVNSYVHTNAGNYEDEGALLLTFEEGE